MTDSELAKALYNWFENHAAVGDGRIMPWLSGIRDDGVCSLDGRWDFIALARFIKGKVGRPVGQRVPFWEWPGAFKERM